MTGDKTREEDRESLSDRSNTAGFESRKASATDTVPEESDESAAEAVNAEADEILEDDVGKEDNSSSPSVRGRLGPLTKPVIQAVDAVRIEQQNAGVRLADAISPAGIGTDIWQQVCPEFGLSQNQITVEEPLVARGDASEEIMGVTQPAYNVTTNQETTSGTCEPTATQETVLAVENPQAIGVTQRYNFVRSKKKTGSKNINMAENINKSKRNKSHSTLMEELFEFDPIGNSTSDKFPIGRRRPQVIIHEQHADETESFEFLCRFLRDYYSTIEGGEPTVEPVEFVTNSPRIPSLSNRILRLDMTGDEWEINSESDALRARRNNTNVLPKLLEIVRTQFSGKLGFLVINVPAKAGASLFGEPQVGAEMYQYFTNELQSDSELSQTVVFASSRNTGDTDWGAKFADYLGFEHVGDNSSIVAVEDAYWNAIEQIDWQAIALTDRQNTGAEGGESAQHYLHKAAIARAIGVEAFESASMTNEAEFFNKQTTECVRTEETADTTVPDITVDLTEDAFVQGLQRLVRAEVPWAKFRRVAFEVETGKQEGAFKFKKVQETLDKIESEEIDFIGIVVPPWVIEIDRNGENIIENLVLHWNNANEEKTAKLLTPRFTSKRCVRLVGGEE